MSYTDAEMVIASQIAYLDFKDDGNEMNVGDLVDGILKQYGTYDASSGEYVMKEDLTGAAEAQFHTAQNILRLSEQNVVNSWRQWTVVNSCNQQNGSGFYGCLIETGEGEAIVGCRGSESYDMEQVVRDWILADVGRLNNAATFQQIDAAKYAEYLYKIYGDKYNSFSFTGHSLGGSLATHMAITAPEGMQKKTDKAISFDGPGFSNEYLEKHEEAIQRIKKKLIHYEYSWVGSLLIQPPGALDKVIKAHDAKDKDIFMAQLWRHDTVNIEFGEDGNVMDGEQGVLQETMGPISKAIEIVPILLLSPYVIVVAVNAYFLSVADQIRQRFDEMIETVKEKVNDLYNAYLSFAVLGDYELHVSEICRMTEDLGDVQLRVNQIADQVADIKRSLPYDSVSAFYYKNCLGLLAMSMKSEGRTAKKISDVVDRAVAKYHQGDQKTAALFGA